MDNLARLIAIEDIKQLKAKYFRGVDMKDMALLRSIFADDMVVDVRGASTDPVTGINASPGVTDRILTGIDDIMNTFASSMGSMTSVHHGHTPEIEITGETTATGIWPMFDSLRFPKGPIAELTAYGHYHETYEKIGGKWKFKTLKLSRLRVDTVPRR